MTYPSKVAWIFLLGFALDLVNMFVATVAYPDIAANCTPRSHNWRGWATPTCSASP